MTALTVIFYLYEDTRKKTSYIERTHYGSWIKTMLKLSPFEVEITETAEGLFKVSSAGNEDAYCVSSQEAQDLQFQRLSSHCENVHSVQKKGYTYYDSFTSELLLSCINPETITSMVYSRIYNPLTKMYEKVWLPIPFSFSMPPATCDYYGRLAVQNKIQEINARIDLYEKKAAEKTYESKKKLFAERAINDELYGEPKETVLEALSRWKDLEYLQPAPTQIRNIKKSLPYSWVELVEYTEKITNTF